MKVVTFDARDNHELLGLSPGEDVCLEVRGTITENDKGKLSMDVQKISLSEKQYDEDEEEESGDGDDEESHHDYPPKGEHKALVIMMRR
jgi:hypothetical protein